jgi:hypothetical protein
MAGVYEGFKPSRVDGDAVAERAWKLINGEWRGVKFDNTRFKEKKKTDDSYIKLPISETSGNYKSIWTFLWLEQRDDRQYQWHDDLRILWASGYNVPGTGTDTNKQAEVQQFVSTEIFPMIKSAFMDYRDEKFSKSPNGKALFDSWISTLDPETLLRNNKFFQADLSEYLGIHIYLYSLGFEPDGWHKDNYVFKVGQLADALGFKDYVKEKSGTDEDVSANEISDLGVERLSEEEKKAVAAALANVNLGLDVNQEFLSNREMLDVSQCALMSDLFNKGYSYKTYPQLWSRGNDEYNKCFNGRIYPVTPSGFDPNELINYCTVPRNIQNFFENDQIVSNNLWWAISWVYQDAEGLKETNIFLNSSDPHNDYSGVKKLVNDKLLTENQIASWDVQKRVNGYVFTDIKIEYDGTNPATARNSVKVTINIDLDHLSSLDTVCGYSKVATSVTKKDGKTTPAKSATIQLKIHDLVTVTQIPSVNVTYPGAKGYQLNTYTPDSSRLRLKVWFDESGFKVSNSGTEAGLIIDLTMIEHELARTDDAQNKTRLTITYRGYFEEAMNAPYNDALATNDMIKNRSAREKKIKEAVKAGCSSQSMREIERVVDETNRAESRQFHNNGGIPGRLMEEGHLYSYSIDIQQYNKGRIGNRLDPKYNYVKTGTIKKASAGGVLTELSASTTGSSTQEKLEEYAAKSGETATVQVGGGFSAAAQRVNRNNNYFFYLGDLLEMVTDCIYEPGKAEHNEHTKGLNMRFILGTFKIPDPQNLSKTITINPAQVPIDYGFFIDWYNDTIVKKEISNYSIGPFIKDLLEKLVNEILYDNCFSLLHLDENPPQFRTTFFTDHGATWFRSTQTIIDDPNAGTFIRNEFDPNSPYGQKTKPNILMKKDVFAPVDQSKNYCVIYQQFPSYFRQVRSNGNPLSSKPTTITLMDGFNNKDKNFCSSLSFSKANSNSYQREALYFGSNNAGSLALMNNVYDLAFKIQTKKMNTFLYPGNIINFIVTDFAGNQWAGGELGESDPHSRGTKANILGYGGYYIVTKVAYKLSIIQSIASATIEVNSKFLGTDAHYPSKKTENTTDSFAEDAPECADVYNAQIDELRVYDIDSAGTFTKASTAGQGSETPLVSGEEAERIHEVVEEIKAAGPPPPVKIVGFASVNPLIQIAFDDSPSGAIKKVIQAGLFGDGINSVQLEINSSKSPPYLSTKVATIKRYLNLLAPDDPYKQTYTMTYDGETHTVMNGEF